ncbi:sensor domain-containing diguanylate cyclase [Gammaproteobacteria bacterium]|nr:sensor domain-containing diguanylate cyclase [Gammaproteobacteria bacterium]
MEAKNRNLGNEANTIESLQSQVKCLEAQCHVLAKSHETLEFVITSTGLGVWDWHVQTGKAIFNERWANIIGYTLEELSPVSIETWMQFAHPEDLEESDRLLKELWAGGSKVYMFESRMKHKDGRWIWVYDTGQVVEWESHGVPKRMMGTHLDITEKQGTIVKLDEANKHLKELSYVDSLTKIPNKRAYDEKLSSQVVEAKRSKSPLSFILIDVDDFKTYNDNYGHEQGDDILCGVAQIIQNALGRKTDFVARLGGDEMAIILPYTDIVGATIIAKRVQQALFDEKENHPFNGLRENLTLSMGVSSSQMGVDSLFEYADAALYMAKKQGRNRIEIYAKTKAR